MKTLVQLRSEHPRLFYKNSSWKWEADGLLLEWHFQLEPDLNFYPSMKLINFSEADSAALDSRELDRYVFNLGMVELLSYWKLAAPGEIVVEAGQLSGEQRNWWHNLLIQGMGEYFFVNQIDFTDPNFVSITSAGEDSGELPPGGDENSQPEPKVLIPLGGGKDSVVTLEMFKQNMPADKLAALVISPTQASRDIAAASGLEVLEVERRLDPLMIQLNDQGYLNGHVPVSAVFAFTSLLAARLKGFQYVAISNERSSNEGNVTFLDRDINHQYSKTFEFEQLFNQYVQENYPQPAPKYFSFVRPLFELQIAKIFANLKAYHSIFRSCNVGQKTNSWCGQCSKCLFAYIILYPFLSESELVGYFGENLLDKPELMPIALELVGKGEKKPLECVGTHEESLAAFHLCWQKSQESGAQNGLLQLVHDQVLQQEENLDSRAQQVLNAWNEQHLIPDSAWEQWLREALK